MTQPVYRFAPSPNGRLHLGHALSAILNRDAATAAGGRFLLRIEDIDVERSRAEFEQAIFDDLAWLGLAWEEPVRRQSKHFSLYCSHLDRLRAMNLLYPAFASRREIAQAVAELESGGQAWPRDPDGAPHYPFGDRDIPPDAGWGRADLGERHTLRLNMAKAMARAGGQLTWQEEGAGPDGQSGTIDANPAAWGDVVLARHDQPASYHLAVVIDDAEQEISHVMRGKDLFWSTSVHRLLQVILGLPRPAYHHHRLILDDGGKKLSKSTQATSLCAIREAGHTPDDIRRMIGV